MNTEIPKNIVVQEPTNFKTWLNAKPYWEKFLWKIHMEKDVLEDKDLEKCYRYLLEDSKVNKELPGRIEIIFPFFDLDSKETPREKITLNRIDNLKEVNAIDDNCVIEFGKDLTIIYGDNGAGKSGIGRLLSNACFSRKPRQLLPNLRTISRSMLKPTASFHISNAKSSEIINYTLGQVNETLRSFSVFDHESALTHLNNENKVEFVPSKIKIFDEVFNSIGKIETLLQKDIEKKRQINPVENIFIGTSPVTSFIDSLSYKTTDKEIEEALKFTSKDKANLNKKNKEVLNKLKQNTKAQKALLQEESRELETLKSNLVIKSTILNETRKEQINDLLKQIKEKREIANKLSVKNFNFHAFKNVGTPEWKSLIIAAKKLHDKETVAHDGIEPSHCVLCQQALSGKEITLFGNYWDFLKSTAETELTASRKTLSDYLATLEKTALNWPDFSLTNIAIKILKKDSPKDLKNIKTGFSALEVQLKDWIKNIKKEQDVSYINSKIDLAPITNLISEKKKQEVALVDSGPSIKILDDEIKNLKHKQQASRSLNKIKNYVKWLRWEKLISTINIRNVRSNTTRKKTDIMGELVISKYVEIFNQETRDLDCNFGLEVKSHGEHVNTIKELKLEFARGNNPSEILSDGEQTVSALADFLTEAKLNKNNFGIIFDDPVSSLDHLRKTIIVKKIVKEAKNRQVIVLTHEIGFLRELQTEAELQSIETKVFSIEKNGDVPGIVKDRLPWNVQKVNARINTLKNQIPSLKAKENGDQDEYRADIKTWYGKLYETWEAMIEEKLLNGVIKRYSNEIHPKAIEGIIINEDIKKQISSGMTNANNWRHDQGSNINRALPKNSHIEDDIKLIEDVIQKCKS